MTKKKKPFEKMFPNFLKEVSRLTKVAEKKNSFVDYVVADRKAMEKTCIENKRIEKILSKHLVVEKAVVDCDTDGSFIFGKTEAHIKDFMGL